MRLPDRSARHGKGIAAAQIAHYAQSSRGGVIASLGESAKLHRIRNPGIAWLHATDAAISQVLRLKRKAFDLFEKRKN